MDSLPRLLNATCIDKAESVKSHLGAGDMLAMGARPPP